MAFNARKCEGCKHKEAHHQQDNRPLSWRDDSRCLVKGCACSTFWPHGKIVKKEQA